MILAFFPESCEYRMHGRSSDLSRFLKPSHPPAGEQWQGFKNHHRLNDRASQQRVLLRILTAFPFHCSDFISPQHQSITNIYDLSIHHKQKY
jgi:hypothetical protein